MLVLTRRIDERIIISGEIEVRIIEIRGNRVKVGIECDKAIPIRRHELAELSPNLLPQAEERIAAPESA